MVIMVSTDVFSPSEAGLSRGRILSSPVSVQHSGVEVYKSEEGLIQQCSSEVHISTEQISHSLGFTAAQKTAFHNGCVDGESVVLLNSVVARSLGINAPSTGTNSDFSSTSLSVRQCLNLDESFNDGAVHGVLDVEDYGNTAYPSVMEEPLVDNSDEVNISVSEIDSDCMMDPDEFLEAGLASGKSEAVVDQDLTSLSWLQSKKLLRDVRVRPAVSSTPVPSPIHILPSSVVSPLPTSLVTSPTSRFDDTSLISVESSDQRVVPTDENTPDVQANENIECKEERLSKFQASSRQLSSPRGRVVSRRPNRRFPVSRMKRPPPYMSYNPRVDVTFKPPFSFSCLIFMAIEDSSMKALPVKEIYNWIMRSFPFYNNMCIGWKNSVRHNLSLNKCFCKVDSGRCSGKGSLWSIDPNYRPTLLYTLRRSSCVTEMPLSIDGHRLPWVSALQQSSPPSPIVSSNSQPLCENGSVCLNRCTGRQRFVKKNELSSAKLVSGGDTISNPELFPFLARRLRTDGGHVDHKLDQQQGLNGRQNTGLREGPHDVVENNVFSDRDCRDYGDEVRSQKHRSGRLNMRLVVIRHYPTDEHTYAIGHTESSVDSNMLEPPIARSSKVRANRKRRLVPSNVCARDMIGITGCSLSGSTAPVSAATVAASSRALQAAEASRRLVEEGADLLLNLAGMSRSQSPHPVPAPVSCSSRWQAETISSHVSTV